MDEWSMYRAHWVVYHKMLSENGEEMKKLGQLLVDSGKERDLYAKAFEYLGHKVEELEKRIAELEANQSQ